MRNTACSPCCLAMHGHGVANVALVLARYGEVVTVSLQLLAQRCMAHCVCVRSHVWTCSCCHTQPRFHGVTRHGAAHGSRVPVAPALGSRLRLAPAPITGLGSVLLRGMPGVDRLPRLWHCLTSHLAQPTASLASPPSPCDAGGGSRRRRLPGACEPRGAAPIAVWGVGPGPLIASADQAGRPGPVLGMRLRHRWEPPSRLAHRR